MAFKSLKTHDAEKYEGWFRLPENKDTADVIFMYQSDNDPMLVDAHYIKSADYSGYVQCCGKDCPACGKSIRIQSKLFIPLYNLTTNKMELWDRNERFKNQLYQDVLSKFPNPSEYVFKITRNGVAGDVDTTYSIVAIGKNNFKTYDQICNELHITFPEYYAIKCKEVSAGELSSMLANSGSPATSEGPSVSLPEYQITPRPIPQITTPIEATPEVVVAPLAEGSVSAEMAPPFDTEPSVADMLQSEGVAEELSDEDVDF